MQKQQKPTTLGQVFVRAHRRRAKIHGLARKNGVEFGRGIIFPSFNLNQPVYLKPLDCGRERPFRDKYLGRVPSCRSRQPELPGLLRPAAGGASPWWPQGPRSRFCPSPGGRWQPGWLRWLPLRPASAAGERLFRVQGTDFPSCLRGTGDEAVPER